MEELVDEFDLKISEIKTCIIVAVELVGQVKDDFILLTSLDWINEFVDQAVADVLDLAVARHKRIEFEGNEIVNVKVRDGPLFV